MASSDITVGGSTSSPVPAANQALGWAACWSAAGVYGDSTCDKLVQFIHCRNCPVYAAAGAQLLSRELPVGYRQERTAHFAKLRQARQTTVLSAVVFRLGNDWLALPTQLFQEVAERRSIHSLPHRHQGVVLGLVNVRGELLIAVSLVRLLGLEESAAAAAAATPVCERLLVVAWEDSRFAFPVDEVHGPQRFRSDELKSPPATIARCNPAYIQHVAYSREQVIGVLDPESLFRSVTAKLG